MERRPFGWTGIPLAVIGQGTWQMEDDDRAAAISALRAGLDAGMTHIDTAELYGSGRVEELVAQALAGRREEVYLVSKVLPENASFEGTLRACEGSLRRLRTDHLDLYLLHWTGPHPLEETFAAFERLQREGKIRAFGVSNFDVVDLERAVAITGERRIVCNQVLYHLEERAIEHAVLPWCERHGIAVVGYSPFGSGRFPAPRTRAGRALQEIAAAVGATPRQVALRFLTLRPSLFAIPKASKEEHALENAGAGDVTLDDEALARVNAAFPLGRPRRDLPTL